MGDEGTTIYSLTCMIRPPLSHGFRYQQSSSWTSQTCKFHLFPDCKIHLTASYFLPYILDPAFANELVLLGGNLTNKPLAIVQKRYVAYIHLLSVNSIVGVAPCGSLL